MNRILVMGISSGVGKSTFARNLGEKLNIEVTHLDSLFWKPGWIEAPIEEFSEAQRKVVQQEQWIIEGNYTNTFEIREVYADTVIYLELPLRVCFFRVLKRRWEYRGKTRPDMGAGCEEKIDKEFLKFILTTYKPRKAKMAERIKKLRDDGKKVIVLTSRRGINNYLKQYY